MHSTLRSSALGSLAILLLAAAAPAQQLARANDSRPGSGGKLIAPADIKAWNSIRQTALSNDGKWFAYVVAPNEGNATLVPDVDRDGTRGP